MKNYSMRTRTWNTRCPQNETRIIRVSLFFPEAWCVRDAIYSAHVRVPFENGSCLILWSISSFNLDCSPLFNDHPLSCFFDVATSISCEWKGKKIGLILFPKRESERITLESEKSIENKVIGKSWKIDWRIVFVLEFFRISKF